MNVSGIRPLIGYYRNQNAYQIAETEDVSEDLVSQSAAKKPETESVSSESDRELKQDFNASDLADQYDSRKSYDLKGKDSDIRSLDVEEAISNMQKDSIIKQYQYFVGDQPELIKSGNSSRDSLQNFDL